MNSRLEGCVLESHAGRIFSWKRFQIPQNTIDVVINIGLLLRPQFLVFPDDCSRSLIGKSSTKISQICAARFSKGSPQIMHDKGYVARTLESSPISKEEHRSGCTFRLKPTASSVTWNWQS